MKLDEIKMLETFRKMDFEVRRNLLSIAFASLAAQEVTKRRYGIPVEGRTPGLAVGEPV